MLYDLVMDSMDSEERDTWEELLTSVLGDSHEAFDVLDLVGQPSPVKAVTAFSARLMGLLIQEAFQLIRSGVTVQVKDIFDWHRNERLAWKFAGEALECRTIYANGVASRGGMHAARFLAALDGGKLHDEMVLDHYAERAADLLS